MNPATPPHRLPLPLGLAYPTVNAYLFTEPEPVLVDCGMRTSASYDALAARLGAHGLAPTDLRKVYITHPHVDHVGLAGVLANTGAEIWMADLAWAWMRDLQANRERLVQLLAGLLTEHGFDRTFESRATDFYRRLSDRFSDLPEEQVRTFSPGESLSFGGTVWESIHAPGHTWRQVCFLDHTSRRLLSADMLLPKAPVPVLEPRSDDPDQRSEGLPDLIESFARFKAMDIETVYPGHGEPFREHTALIGEQVARIERRKAECLALIEAGTGRLPDLLEAMYAGLTSPDRLGGLAMLVGYLDLLLREGRVRARWRAGIRIFGAV